MIGCQVNGLEKPSRRIPASSARNNLMSKLETREISKTYRGRRVVDDVSLFVQQGEVVGLLGPNGAGKTTSFYMIVGLISPDSGRILVDEQDITDLPMYQRARRGISYLPQEASVFRKLTVEENLMAILETLPAALPRAPRDDGPPASTSSASKRSAAARATCSRAASAAASRSPAPWSSTELSAAGRAVLRHRPDSGAGTAAHHLRSEALRHRHPGHRPQRARNAGGHRSRLHHQQRTHFPRRQPGSAGARSRSEAYLSRRNVSPCACDSRPRPAHFSATRAPFVRILEL